MNKLTITREQVQKIIDAADEVITALAGTNDDFHPDNSTKMVQLYDDLNDRYAPPEVVRELALIALVVLTAEPVAWRLVDSPESSVTVTDNEKMAAIWKRNGRNVKPLYSTAHGSADAVGMVVSEGRQPSAHNPESRIFEVLVESGYEPVPGDKLYAAPPASERERIRRAAMLHEKFRDLSQPVDPQVAEYEQIMLQAGWVMVPVEPTDEMIAAAMECDDVVFDSKDPTVFCVQFREIYCAMVDAAPKPEEITDELA